MPLFKSKPRTTTNDGNFFEVFAGFVVKIRAMKSFFIWTAALVLGAMPACTGGRRPVIEEIAHYNTAGWAHNVAVESQLLYVSDRQGGYLIFDWAAGWAAPRIFAPVQDIISLAPHAGRPLLAARFEGLVLVSPTGAVRARFANGDIANAVVTRDELAFAAYGSHGLVVVVLGKSDLRLLAELPTPGWSHNVKLWGDRALLADWNYGLRVVDVRRPETPVEIAALPSPATSICIALGEAAGNTVAAVAEGHGGVSLVAFDADGTPSLIARHALGLNPTDAPHPETGGWAHGVALCRNYLFVANWKRGLAVLDIRDLRHPHLVKEVPTRGTSLGVKAIAESGGTIRIFLADGEDGLRVFRFRAL